MRTPELRDLPARLHESTVEDTASVQLDGQRLIEESKPTGRLADRWPVGEIIEDRLLELEQQLEAPLVPAKRIGGERSAKDQIGLRDAPRNNGALQPAHQIPVHDADR